MAKLEGFERVAVVKYGCSEYHFALYDDDIKVGDKVVLSGISNYTEVTDIITAEEAAKKFKKDITQEVICKIDTSAYDQRVENRKKKEQIRKQMEKRKKELQALKDNEYYAGLDEEFAAMYEEYKNL